MSPILDRWLTYARNLPENLNPRARAQLEWAFYTGAAAAFTELRPRQDEQHDQLMRRTIRRELEEFAARVEEEMRQP